MKRLVATLSALLTAVVWPVDVTADPANQYGRANVHGNQVMVRAAAVDVPAIAAQYGLAVVGESANADGHLAIVEGPETMTAEQIEALILGDPRIESSEAIHLATLPGTAETGTTPVGGGIAVDRFKAGSFSSPCLSQVQPAALWKGYGDQEAARLVRLHRAHLEQTDCGATVVAVIDTGVDPDHPVLADALVPGYDFLLGRAGLPSEWDFLDQSLQPILEQSLQPILEQSLQPILEQSLQPILEATLAGEAQVVALGNSMAVLLDNTIAPTVAAMTLPSHFGHGTMVTGIVRLSAPGAQIMPLRAFNSRGAAHLFDIIRAIHYAVDHGADVINMSFSVPESSHELRRAIQYARSQGVICVAAAGNDGERIDVYPAKYKGTIGVAATTLDDTLSEFSNYGSDLVELAAPGAGVVSTYPGGLFAAGWGTSFSAPFVSGTAALIHPLQTSSDPATFQSLLKDLRQGSVSIQQLAGDIGSGRLDALGAVRAAD